MNTTKLFQHTKRNARSRIRTNIPTPHYLRQLSDSKALQDKHLSDTDNIAKIFPRLRSVLSQYPRVEKYFLPDGRPTPEGIEHLGMSMTKYNQITQCRDHITLFDFYNILQLAGLTYVIMPADNPIAQDLCYTEPTAETDLTQTT